MQHLSSPMREEPRRAAAYLLRTASASPRATHRHRRPKAGHTARCFVSNQMKIRGHGSLPSNHRRDASVPGAVSALYFSGRIEHSVSGLIKKRMDSRKLALLCREIADNKKAEDIVILDLRKISSITDYFVICTGTSEPHLRAIVGEIQHQLGQEQHLTPRGTDGTVNTAWVVLDYFDVIVHVMRADVRRLYQLEDLWGDAPVVKPRRKKAVAAA